MGLGGFISLRSKSLLASGCNSEKVSNVAGRVNHFYSQIKIDSVHGMMLPIREGG